MRHASGLAFASLALIAGVGFLACGGNRPAEQAASAPAEPAAATPSSSPAEAAPPTVQTAPPRSTEHVAPTRSSAPKSTTRAAAAAAPNPEPTPPPKPPPVTKTVAAGTELDVELVDGVSSATSQVGSAVRARVMKGIVVDGLVVVPAGSIIDGTVAEATPLKKIGGTASLGLRFDTLEAGASGRVAIATGLREQGKSETGKDAGTIAGATAGGALLGRLLSKNHKTNGTLIGAAVGAAAGTGIAASTKGQEVELPAGTALALHLEQPVEVTFQP
jgi:hypothetical protein